MGEGRVSIDNTLAIAQAVKGAVESSFAPANAEKFLRSLERAGLRHVPDVPTVAWPYVVLAIDELGALLNAKGTVADEIKAANVLGKPVIVPDEPQPNTMASISPCKKPVTKPPREGLMAVSFTGKR